MKRLSVLALLPIPILPAMAALQAGGDPIVIADSRNPALVDTKVVIPQRGVLEQLTNGRLGFSGAGGVVITSKSRGMTIRATSMKGAVEPDPVSPRKGALRLGDLTATGDFALDRRISRAGPNGIPGTSRLTQIRSEIATYATPNRDDVFLTLSGGVKIVENSRSVLTRTGSESTITGNSGNATLKNTAGESTLQTAVIRDNVRINMVQLTVDAKTGKPILQPYNAKGDRLDYAALAGGGGTITLSGNLDFDTPGASNGGQGFVISGPTKAVLTLNARNEIVRSVLTTDSTAARIKTTIPIVKKRPSR